MARPPARTLPATKGTDELMNNATERTPPAQTAAPSPEIGDYMELARLISGVLNHPLTPDGVETALAEALSNITNTEAMDAPQTIGSILYHHAKRHVGEGA